MKLMNKKDNQIIFTAEIEESLANAIRRYVNEILIPTIDKVEILKNDSPLYDETVAHRLGLIPLRIKGIVNEKTSDEIKLNVKKQGFVCSGEMVGKIKPVYENIPITSLNKDQELNLIATVRAGKGSKHSKFSPGLIFYRNVFDIKIDKDCPQEVTKACPKGILDLKEGRVTVKDNLKCDMCEACLEICKKQKKDSIQITPTKELLITVESFGQMSDREMFNKAIEKLKKDLEEVNKKTK